jgi:hypothetical protein
MAIREEDQRQVVALLRQHGGVQTGKAVAAAAKLTEKQQLALLADYRTLVKPLRTLAESVLAAADKIEPAKVEPAAEVPATDNLNASNAELTT